MENCKTRLIKRFFERTKWDLEQRKVLRLFLFSCCTLACPHSSLAAPPPPALQPAVEAEEDIYSFGPANNGAGPLWCGGSTCLVQTSGKTFASGLETLEGVKPLNNCRWTLFERVDHRWELSCADTNRTREPAPLAVFRNGCIFLSANPTLAPLDAYSGPARPEILEFNAGNAKAPVQKIVPTWDGQPKFTEHSYRSFAADAVRGELLLLQNIDYDHAEWTFRDETGQWSAHGQLKWPMASEYERPQPLRLCYPNVALKNRAVYFCGIGDIVEPFAAWRAFKKERTGQEWDYVFRRLFYSWSADVRAGKFQPWLELANYEKTAGSITPGDLWVAANGAAHVVWTERRLDERLRDRFFPGEPQSYAIQYVVIDRGQITRRRTLMTSEEGGSVFGRARLHASADGRLFVVYFEQAKTSSGQRVPQNRILELLPDGATSTTTTLPLKYPMMDFFTASERAGSPPSGVLQLLGQTAKPRSISYARILLWPGAAE